MKLLIIWSISAFLFVSTCGASSTDEHGNNESFIEILTDAERAWVEKGEPLTYVYDPDWPPFEWKDENDNHTGIIADLLELLLEKTGLNLIPSHTNTWSESVALVREGKADMFSAVTVTEERKQFLDFTAKDIYTYPAVLVTQFDDYEVYLDLEKDALLKTIAVVKDSGLGQYIKESFPKNTYVEVPSTKRGFAAVVDGDADLFAINAVTARYFIEKKYQSEIKIATKLDFTYSLKVASHQNLPPEVISILEKALNTISGDEQDAIFKRWTSVEKRREVSWEVVVRVSVAFLIILALLGWHNIKLKKLVNQRTRELSKSKDRLELKVEHRTKELKQAMQDAKNANHTKDEFLASMSHELRTPLTSIIGNAEYLDEKLTTPELLEVVSHIQGAGQAQLSLVSDILDMSKIDSGKFSIDEYPYNLSQLLKDIGGMLSIRVEDAGLLLLIDQKNEEKFELLGDSQRIGQILINIIGNAIKFTEQGEIRLTTKRDEQEQWLLFEVQDTGVGMTPEEQSHLFKKFEQADGSISRRFGGSGLGLYISFSLAQMMGGKITAASSKGVGSTFLLQLPYRKSGVLASSTTTITGSGSLLNEKFDGHVLIVEDTPELQMLERRILEGMGLTVTTANDGQEAVDLAVAHSYDLIFMDMQMPVMDGIEATNIIRERKVDTPIYALTANVMVKHRELFDEAGCNGFIAKPIDKEQLRGVLRKNLSQYDAYNDLGCDQFQYIKWSDEFSVGHPLMDEEHIKITYLVNELIRFCRHEEDALPRDKLLIALSNLHDLVITHVQHEEELLYESGYPELIRHKDSHQNYWSQLSRQYGQKLNDERIKVIAALLLSWWKEHILIEDMAYKEHVSTWYQNSSTAPNPKVGYNPH